MEKEICRRHFTREGIGCVWVFMSMFEFRHGRSNQKLLIDKKRGSKRIKGIETKIEKQLTYNCEESESEMQSVKKLIEEEIDEKIQQKCELECRGRTKRRSRTFSKTSEDINVLIACDDDDDHADQRISLNEVDLINDDSEEKFSDLIKRLIAQKEGKKTLEDSQRIKECSTCTQTIVVLKHEPNSLDNVGLSPETKATCNKAKHKSFGSRLALSRISRRLKSSLGKTPYNSQHDSDQDLDALSSNMSQDCCLGEDIETTKEDTIHGSEDKKKSMCGIYIAAKKHLSEMLAEGDIDLDLPNKEEPRILGKILAFPEFSTPDTSPRITLAHDFVGEKQKIQQCSSQDYCKTLGLDSNKHEKTELDSLSEANEQETLEERQSPSSPQNSSIKISECQENASPVSVLEPFFTDDDNISPNSSNFSSVERRLQPLCIRFDEPDDSPRSDKDMDDKEVILAYIESVMKSSDLNWEELLTRSFYSNQLLEQALVNDIEFCSTNLCTNKKLLFDCINEVLMEFCKHGPWISFIKPEVRFSPEMENAVEVVQEEVYWHLLPLPFPHTLDQIVRKDLARRGSWMDLRFDIGYIGSETAEIVLDELLEEVIRNCTELF